MGVCGFYTRIDKEIVDQLQNGEIHVFEVFNLPEVDGESDCLLYIYKYWHVIDFILVGDARENATDNPLSKVVLGGGIPVGDEHASALLKTPEEISEVNQALATVSEKSIREGFSLAEMKKHGIYLADAYNNEDEVVKDVYGALELISRFFKDAEQNRQWILLSID